MIFNSDISAAVYSKWASAGLDSTCPGGIRSGRRSPWQQGATTEIQMPFACLTVKKGKDSDWYTEGRAVGARYNAYYLVTIEIYGTGELTTGNNIKAIATTFCDQNWIITGGTLQAADLSDWDLTQEPGEYQGDDIWRGKLVYEVTVTGSL